MENGPRRRFDFGASPSWSSGTEENGTASSSSSARPLPGSFIRDEPVEIPIQPELHEPAPTPPPPPNQSQSGRERTCRICLAGPEDGRLISPCRCRGTMKFVHLSCLNAWRYNSPNRKSVYQCDQCGYKYNFNRTQYAAIIGSLYARIAFTILAFVTAVFISGFVFKLVLYLTGATLPLTHLSALLDFVFGIDPIDSMSAIDLDTWGYRPPRTLNEVFFTGFGDAAHWALGVVGLALYGFVSLMTGLGAFGIHLRLGNWRRRAVDAERRRRGATLGGIMWGILILIGTAKVLKAIYLAVDLRIQLYQTRLETAILEVDPDGE